MGEVASSPRVARFGVFEVDLRAGELRKKGVRVRLQEQPLRVLGVLLERPGEVVTREELKQRLWPDTVVDFDHSLNTTINKLREALGDAADAPRFIETLPRRGYRFLCSVEHVQGVNGVARVDGVHAIDVAPPPRRGARRRRPTLALLALAVVLAAALAIGAGPLRGRPAPPPEARAINSLAVLPFKNLSGDRQRDDLVDGMTEALTAELGRIGALRVLSHRSLMRYRESTKPLPDIAAEVGVDAFLVGSVLHAGDRVRITASLVQASPERQLWGESYELGAGEVHSAHKELVRDVADQVRVRLTPREQVQLAYARRVHPEAYEAYLIGRVHLSRVPNAANTAKAREYFQKAIEKDPGYAPAYSGLAALEMRHRGSPTRKVPVGRSQARQWIEKALELDDTLAEAHAILARIAQQEWDFAAAEREYRRAIELNPSDAQARIGYALFLDAMQRFEEAVVQARSAQQLDPVSPKVHTWACATHFYAGGREEATAACRRALELDPSYSDASLVLARALLAEGRSDEAISELRKALAFDGRQALVLGALAHVHARAGQREEALKLVRELGRIEAEEPGYVAPFGTIWAHAGLGDHDAAFARLEKAYQERVDRVVWLNVDPLLAPLRSDPRFGELARRVGLPARSSPPPRRSASR